MRYGYGIGNLSLSECYKLECYDGPYPDTGEPFAIVDSQYYSPTVGFYANKDGEHNYEVIEIVENIIEIEEKYVASAVYPKFGPFFASCYTSASSVTKYANSENGYPIKTLRNGTVVYVNFLFNNNTASNPALEFDGTGAKAICNYSGNNVLASQLTRGIHCFVYVQAEDAWYFVS